MSVASHQGKSQIIAEIATISAVQHRNLVKLYGCCINGQIGTYFEECLGVARELTYLHQQSRLRIVHRDVKSSNILLDSDLNLNISDFGLAKLYDDKKTHMSTNVVGT
ncbi:hypothetical protein RDABS01_010433, partial [Bienertia sinuspersici]